LSKVPSEASARAGIANVAAVSAAARIAVMIVIVFSLSLEQLHKYCEAVSFVLGRRSSTGRRRGHLSLALHHL
jgi:hypothetical protein